MAGPSVVQSATHAVGSSPATVSFAATTAGNLLVAIVAGGGYSLHPTYTTPSGWTLLDSLTDNLFTNLSASVFYYPNCPSGLTSLSITAANANGLAILFYEISGPPTSGPIDIHPTWVSSAASTGHSLSGTTTAANDLVLGITAVDETNGTATYSNPSGWTHDKDITDSNGFIDISGSHQTVATAGACTYNPTWVANTDAMMFLVAILAAGGGGSTVNGSATLVGQGVLDDTANTLIARSQTVQANSGLSVSATLITVGETVQGNAALGESAALDTQAVLSGTSSASEAATLLAPATLQGNAALTANPSSSASLVGSGALTVAALVLAPAPIAATSAIIQATAVIDTSATPQGNTGLTQQAVLLASGTALQGNAVLAAAGNANAASLIGNAALTVVARVIAAASLPAESALRAAATLLATPFAPGNASLNEVAIIATGAVLQSNSGLQASNAVNIGLIAQGALTATATVLTHASAQASGVLDATAQLLANPALVGNSSMLAVKVWPPLVTARTFIQKLLATFSTVQYLQATFTRSVSVATPNSTVTVTMQVKDSTGALQSNLAAIDVTVTFPDSTTQAFSLVGSTVTNLGSGNYAITYTTKGIGECLEDWAFTAVDGVTKAEYHDVTPVSY